MPGVLLAGTPFPPGQLLGRTPKVLGERALDKGRARRRRPVGSSGTGPGKGTHFRRQQTPPPPARARGGGSMLCPRRELPGAEARQGLGNGQD